MAKIESLKENHNIRRVFYKGFYTNCNNIIVYVLSRRRYGQTLAISVSKKSGNAVERNRIKRVIRSAYINVEDKRAFDGCDIVIVGKKTVLSKKSTEIEKEIKKATENVSKRMRNNRNEKGNYRFNKRV